ELEYRQADRLLVGKRHLDRLRPLRQLPLAQRHALFDVLLIAQAQEAREGRGRLARHVRHGKARRIEHIALLTDDVLNRLGELLAQALALGLDASEGVSGDRLDAVADFNADVAVDRRRVADRCAQRLVRHLAEEARQSDGRESRQQHHAGKHRQGRAVDPDAPQVDARQKQRAPEPRPSCRPLRARHGYSSPILSSVPRPMRRSITASITTAATSTAMIDNSSQKIVNQGYTTTTPGTASVASWVIEISGSTTQESSTPSRVPPISPNSTSIAFS